MIAQASVADYEVLIKIWEDSVRATHHFITEQDIQFYRQLILDEGFRSVALFCDQDEKHKITGFMGICGNKLEMLFVAPAERGKGIGKQLVTYAIAREKVMKVDVNEQNEQAVGFYRHMGFAVINRSDVDGMGKPYPILSMQLS
ncbi:acetyltransferase|uniref:Putative acetyltransferase n=1 Tax=Dendrosporobacter quercicolus TaxID=146817 RepID=A0A1G9NAR0_9FIRM|nr:acetyltransferase [Dendrosporobacter quercicolus]NSL47277.1 acetyltransferase [Dendrosporobacter quercicolus DSM 1736]SDL83411.1 putative acetyltransferase [Dendrosporobacter quercicolus]